MSSTNVSIYNMFLEGETRNDLVTGILTLGVLVALETAVEKMFFKSREMNTKVVLRKEIFARLSGFRSIKELLSGVDYKEKRRGGGKEEQDDTQEPSASAGEPVNVTATGRRLAAQPKSRSYHSSRLLIPSIVRFLLLCAELAVIALGGQRLVSDGNGLQPAYALVERPLNGSSTLHFTRQGCTSHLSEVRSEQASGHLQMCVRPERLNVCQYSIDHCVLRLERDYLRNTAEFKIFTNDSCQKRLLSLTTTYQSHDGFSQTLMPLDDMPTGLTGTYEGANATCTMGVTKNCFLAQPEQERTIRVDTLNLILDKLLQRLGVPDDDRMRNFGEGQGAFRREGIGLLLMNATFRWTGTHDQVLTALNTTLLRDFELKPAASGDPMISFDQSAGLYGPELGDGAKVRQFNLVPSIVWAVMIVGLAVVAIVFDRINTIDVCSQQGKMYCLSLLRVCLSHSLHSCDCFVFFFLSLSSLAFTCFERLLKSQRRTVSLVH